MSSLPRTLALGLFAGLAMLLLGAISLALHQPLLFPAIGASAALIVLAPQSKGAQPRSIILGHGVGALIGWLCVQSIAGGAQGSLATLHQWSFVLSGSAALAATAAALVHWSIPHPPAAATTMIVGMGLLPQGAHALAMVGAALLLALLARLLLGWAGQPLPWWAQ